MKNVAAVTFWLLMAMLIVLPAMHARLALPASASQVLIAGVALALLLHAMAALPGLRWRAVLVPLLISVLVIRLGFWGLVQFSGGGYTAEAMSHLTWESVTVAWQAFRVWAVIALVVLAALLAVVGFYLGGAQRRGRALPLWTALPALLLLLACHAGTPEWQLLQGIHETQRRPQLVVDAELEQRWQDSGLVDLHVPAIADVRASAADEPVNLILLYLESVGSALLEHPRWPGLMPNLHELAQSHSLVGEFHASGFVTIEGIVNSQCGTLLPLPGNKGFAEGGNLAAQLPCLGDVLAKAGYRQVYLGGADMSFAGKGRFLGEHGYDTRKGMEHWRSLGMKQRRGTWGLSDADLFEQSLNELEALHEAGRPFNLTMLTIGTHIPGYTYAECSPWHDADPFLNAAHCTDQLVQHWIDALQQRDLLRNTVLVITADHHVFPNPAMRSLFDDAVTDRRLPLIVMGEGADVAAVQPRGASYDLAPTLLDLLGVEHNARFVLGRSLLHAQARPDYFIRRYQDVQAGEPVENPHACAPLDETAPALPLDHCAKLELGDLLASVADSYSHQQAGFSCAQPVLVELPDDVDAPARFMVGGEEQGGNFVWRGRNPAVDAKGFFILFTDAEGHILERYHLPATELEKAERLPAWWHEPWQDGVARVLVAWRAPLDTDALVGTSMPLAPGWQAQQSAVWLWHVGDGTPALVAQTSPGDTQWRLEPSQCRRLLGD